MKLTKELKAKIERIFKEKRAVVYATYDKAVTAAADGERENLAQEVTNMCGEYPKLAKAIKLVVRNNSHYGRPMDIPITSAEVVSYFFARGVLESYKELNAAKNEGIATLDKQEEDLLIQISYAENMGELKSLFSSAGIEW